MLFGGQASPQEQEQLKAQHMFWNGGDPQYILSTRLCTTDSATSAINYNIYSIKNLTPQRLFSLPFENMLLSTVSPD